MSPVHGLNVLQFAFRTAGGGGLLALRLNVALNSSLPVKSMML